MNLLILLLALAYAAWCFVWMLRDIRKDNMSVIIDGDRNDHFGRINHNPFKKIRPYSVAMGKVGDFQILKECDTEKEANSALAAAIEFAVQNRWMPELHWCKYCGNQLGESKDYVCGECETDREIETAQTAATA